MNAWAIVVRNLYNVAKQALAMLPYLIIGLGTLVLIILFGRILDRILIRIFRRTNLRWALAQLLRKLIYAGVWVVAITVAGIVIFPSLTPGRVVTALGFTSIALGFAFKDIIQNFLAGILILVREPFALGDFIDCNNKQGRVEKIDLRYTYLRQVDGQRVVLPNATLFTNTITVQTDWTFRRITFIINIGYDSDLSTVRDLMHQAVRTCKTVNKDKSIEIFIHALAYSSVDYEVTWWAGSTPQEERESIDEVAEAVKKTLMDAGHEIAYQYRTLVFKEPLHIIQDAPKESNPDSANKP